MRYSVLSNLSGNPHAKIYTKQFWCYYMQQCLSFALVFLSLQCSLSLFVGVSSSIKSFQTQIFSSSFLYFYFCPQIYLSYHAPLTPRALFTPRSTSSLSLWCACVCLCVCLLPAEKVTLSMKMLLVWGAGWVAWECLGGLWNTTFVREIFSYEWTHKYIA